MLSKNKIKFINSLKIKKYRAQNHAFIAEGEKIIGDILKSGLVPKIIVSNNQPFLDYQLFQDSEKIFASAKEISEISSLSAPQNSIAVFPILETVINLKKINSPLLFCDSIQNPGNLGTIIRTAEWFGIKNVICTNKSADFYNPKTIQSTMGAIARVSLTVVETHSFFEEAIHENFKTFGAFLGGTSIYETNFSKKMILIIGNEGNGISTEIEKYIDNKITIPRYVQKAESLNAAMATGIILAEYKRRF